MIVLNDITKTFTNGSIETHVLKGVTLEIQEGEFVAIMGRSGAGKSTLMYQMGLLDHPTSGSLVVNNTQTELLSSEERTQFRLKHLGYVFQDYALVPELTAKENIMIPLLMQGYSETEAGVIASNSLERIGLANRLNNLPSQLSGGEQQRVSIARAIAHNPKIVFADEPTANLDSISSKTVLEIFEKLHKEGQTIVMVTHEAEYTHSCDRIIILEDGKILREEKPTPLS